MSHKRKKLLKSSLATLILMGLSLVFLYPFIWMFFSSFKNNREIYQTKQLMPEKMTPSYYQNKLDQQAPQTAPNPSHQRAQSFRLKRLKRFEAELHSLEQSSPQSNPLSPQQIAAISQLKAKIEKLKQTKPHTEPPSHSDKTIGKRSFSSSLNLAAQNIDTQYFDILLNSNQGHVSALESEIQELQSSPSTLETQAKINELQAQHEFLHPYQYFDFKQVFWNSFFVAILHAFGAVFFSAAAGYVFAKFNFKAKKALFILAILVILIPKQTLILPLFEWLNFINLGDQHAGIILPGMLNAIGFIFFIQIYKHVPDDLLDLYRLEGANELKVFYHSLPLVSSALLSFGLIDFIMAWNEHLLPLIILQDPAKQTLPLALSQLMGSSLGEPLAVIMAGSLFTLLPSLLLFGFMYKRIKSAMSELVLH